MGGEAPFSPKPPLHYTSSRRGGIPCEERASRILAFEGSGRPWISTFRISVPWRGQNPSSESREARTGSANPRLESSSVPLSTPHDPQCRWKMPGHSQTPHPRTFGARPPSAKRPRRPPDPAESGAPTYHRTQISKPMLSAGPPMGDRGARLWTWGWRPVPARLSLPSAAPGPTAAPRGPGKRVCAWLTARGVGHETPRPRMVGRRSGDFVTTRARRYKPVSTSWPLSPSHYHAGFSCLPTPASRQSSSCCRCRRRRRHRRRCCC